MSDAKTPVAIRIVRPYGSPEEFVRGDIESLNKTSITLAGAQPRPKGVILRFEVTLASGRPVMRGEGRVLGYADDTGLTLRFTRLDPKSKALVDWAAGIKDARAKGLPEPAPPELPSGRLPAERPSEPDVAKTKSAAPKPAPSRPAPAKSSPASDPSPPPASDPSPPPASDPAPPASFPTLAMPMPAVQVTSMPMSMLDEAPTINSLDEAPTAGSVEDMPTIATTKDSPILPELVGLPPPNDAPHPTAPRAASGDGRTIEIAPPKKAELLDRLRARARTLGPEAVQGILKRRAP